MYLFTVSHNMVQQTRLIYRTHLCSLSNEEASIRLKSVRADPKWVFLNYSVGIFKLQWMFFNHFTWRPTHIPSPKWIKTNQVKRLKMPIVVWKRPMDWVTPTSISQRYKAYSRSLFYADRSAQRRCILNKPILSWSCGQQQHPSPPMCAFGFHQNFNADPTYFKHWNVNLN